MADVRVFVPPPRSSPSGAKGEGRQRLAQLSNGSGDMPSSPLSSGKTVKPAPAPTTAPESVERDVAMAESDEDDCKPPLHVEVRIRDDSTIRVDRILTAVRQLLEHQYESVALETALPAADWAEYPLLHDNVDRIYVAEAALTGTDSLLVQLSDYDVCIHVYQPLPFDTPLEQFSAAATGATSASQVSRQGGIGAVEDETDPDDDVMAASVLELPSQTIEGQWEALVYDSSIKTDMLNYIYTTVLLSDSGLQSSIIAFHRLALLHGPPGTGKTSLCRALAQKLAIRMSDRFYRTRLVEINAHSLFSKWFSESGKLVQRLFARVHELCDEVDPDDDAGQPFVVVLIDEVESLTAARAGAMSGKEPSDALRVVNALLTQLDRLKQRSNVLVLTTSNLPSAIDTAFVDRADVKFMIPLPPARAVYTILRSCLLELMRVRLVVDAPVPDWSTLAYEPTDIGVKLRELALRCHAVGMSGRTLRRLPMLAHARHLGMGARLGTRVKVDRWLAAMATTIEEEAVQLDHMVVDSV